MANGRTDHNSTVLVPATRAKSPPRTTPSRLPPIACTVVRPVPSAFDRSTWSVPRTTQKPVRQPHPFRPPRGMAKAGGAGRLCLHPRGGGVGGGGDRPEKAEHAPPTPPPPRRRARHFPPRPPARRDDRIAAERDRQVGN